MRINWKIRFKNPVFWTGLVGVLGTLLVGLAQLCGIDISAEVGGWQDALGALITSVFGILALLGIAVDPTTKGIGDSEEALTYRHPKEF